MIHSSFWEGIVQAAGPVVKSGNAAVAKVRSLAYN